MKNIYVVIAINFLFIGLVTNAMADPVWYDATQQAIAFDAYSVGSDPNGWGGHYYFDFDADHNVSAFIIQTTVYGSGGQATHYGEKVGNVNTAFGTPWLYQYYSFYGFSSYVANHWHFFAPVWNVATGDTIIYLRPTDSSNNDILVTQALLSDFYFQLDTPNVSNSDWQQLADPVPEPTTMLLLGTGLVGVAGAARRKKKNQA